MKKRDRIKELEKEVEQLKGELEKKYIVRFDVIELERAHSKFYNREHLTREILLFDPLKTITVPCRCLNY
mgnify:CR=1 FL=1|tara:strand:+ start:408 stop:617 length:210 start_codon:yes stop_codon:yes gene_type:complete